MIDVGLFSQFEGIAGVQAPLLAGRLLQGSDPQTAPANPAWDGGGSLAVIFVTLILLCGATVAAYLYVRRGGLPRLRGQAGQLQILETRMLGGRQFLVVAAYGRQKLLLGVCPGKIDYLCNLSAADETAVTATAAGESAFARVLGQQQSPPRP